MISTYKPNNGQKPRILILPTLVNVVPKPISIFDLIGPIYRSYPWCPLCIQLGIVYYGLKRFHQLA